MNRIKMSNTLEVSRLIQGMWRLKDWNMSEDELLSFIESCISLGITTFDHADIYGDYECESLFGRVLKNNPSLRNKIEIITKCGIKLVSDKFPDTKKNHYNTSYEHIIKSVDNSLKNLNTDHIDLLLIHRPSPLMNPHEISKAFSYLKNAGKVKNFGVSNFTNEQYKTLDLIFNNQLVTNQVEISVNHLDSFKDGTIDYLFSKNVSPLAWSPLAGGKLFQENRNEQLLKKLEEIAYSFGLSNYDIDIIMYAWILKHPINIIPIIGSSKIERVEKAVRALDIKLSDEQWFDIFIASQGYPMP